MKLRLIFTLLVLFSCENASELTIDKNIILVNAGHANRTEVSELLNKLTLCNPKIVGMNLVFEGRRDLLSDTLLANSIKKAGNVIMVSLPREKQIINSDSLFTQNALAQGLLYYGFTDDSIVSKQMMYISNGDDLMWSFPTTIASYFDIDHSDNIMKSAQGNQFYEIDFSNNFQTIDITDEFDCSSLAGKIILVGYLGPADEDTYLIPGDEKKYSLWILGNCIRNILDNHFEAVD